MRHHKTFIATTLLALSFAAQADVSVDQPWVRATAMNAKATGAFMTLTSSAGGTLISAKSTGIPVVEVHEMAMEGGVMKMRAIPKLPLPAKQPVELKPGSYHIMLMDLKAPIKAGDKIPLTLTVEEGGKQKTIEVMAEAREMTAKAAAAGHQHHNH